MSNTRIQPVLTRGESELVDQMAELTHTMLIPINLVGDSDLKPITRSDGKPIRVGAKRRWRSYPA
jgi:hypothetical protein